MKKIVLLFTLAFLLGVNLEAQKFLQPSNLKKTPASNQGSFGTVDKAFQIYWENKSHSEKEGENAEEGGWQQYKRWKSFMEPRTFPKGEFPSPEILFSEYKKAQLAQREKRSVGQHVATAANWAFVGPHVIPANGGGAGRINCMAFDPVNSQILWVGAACGGLWKTTDGGNTWSSNTDLLPSLSISDILIDRSNSQTMYLATGDKYGIYYGYKTWGHYSAGVLKSTDGGQTWNPTGLSYSFANISLIERLIQDPINPNTLYAATNTGIYETQNGGTTWNNIRPGRFYDIEMNPANNNILYTGDSTGLLVSTNAGVSWAYASGVSSTGRTSIAVTAANPSVVYVWAEGGNNFYYSNNSAVSFTQLTDPGSNATPYGYYDMVLEVSSLNANLLFTGGLNVATSVDGGNTWNTVNTTSWPGTNYVHADNHDLRFANGSSTVVYSCNDGGIFKSTDAGTTWTDLSGGIDIKEYYRLSSSFQSANLIYAGAQDNGTDRVTGVSTATQVMGADGEDCLVDFTNDQTVFASWQGGNFSRSTDGGNTFNPTSVTGCDWTSPIVMDPNNNNIIYMGASNVYQSPDNGVTWNSISASLDGSCLRSIVVSKSNGNYIYAASFGNIFRTTNGGTTWTNINGNLPVANAAISGIAVKGTNPDVAWVTFSGFSAADKVYGTTDGGQTWTNLTYNLPNIPANCIVYQYGSNDLLYVGTDMGVYYMDATMNTWSAYNTGLPNVIIDELEVYYPASTLRAATYGRGLWESPLQTSSFLNLDAGTSTMVNPPLSTCDTLITPIVKIDNAGLDTIFSVNLHYRMDAQTWQLYHWTGTMATLGVASITLPTYTLSAGTHILKAYTDLPNAQPDQNTANDTLQRSFTILSSAPGTVILPPVVQGFETTSFPPTNWNLNNPGNLLSRYTSAGGYGLSSSSMLADFYNVPAGNNATFTTDYVNFSNAQPPIRLKFDLAYAPYTSGPDDSLLIVLYRQCPPLNEVLYAKGGASLATVAAMTNQFSPSSSQWRTDTLKLDSLAGHAPVQIRFIAKSGFGNELYIDNINLSGSALGIQEMDGDHSLAVYPNPANGMLNIGLMANPGEKVVLELYDLLGKQISKLEEHTGSGMNTYTMDVSGISTGVYLLKVQDNQSVRSRRISIVR